MVVVTTGTVAVVRRWRPRAPVRPRSRGRGRGRCCRRWRWRPAPARPPPAASAAAPRPLLGRSCRPAPRVQVDPLPSSEAVPVRLRTLSRTPTRANSGATTQRRRCPGGAAVWDDARCDPGDQVRPAATQGGLHRRAGAGQSLGEPLRPAARGRVVAGPRLPGEAGRRHRGPRRLCRRRPQDAGPRPGGDVRRPRGRRGAVPDRRVRVESWSPPRLRPDRRPPQGVLRVLRHHRCTSPCASGPGWPPSTAPT